LINRANNPLDCATCHENCPLTEAVQSRGPKVVGSNPTPATKDG